MEIVCGLIARLQRHDIMENGRTNHLKNLIDDSLETTPIRYTFICR